MAITGSMVDWALVWEILGWTALACAITFTGLYLLRKRINRVTFPLWRKPWVAWQAWSARHPRARERARR